MSEIKYPDIDVQLVGCDGNAGAIMARVVDGLRSHGVSSKEINEYRMESMSGTYDDLLETACRWVNVY